MIGLSCLPSELTPRLQAHCAHASRLAAHTPPNLPPPEGGGERVEVEGVATGASVLLSRSRDPFWVYLWGASERTLGLFVRAVNARLVKISRSFREGLFVRASARTGVKIRLVRICGWTIKRDCAPH